MVSLRSLVVLATAFAGIASAQTGTRDPCKSDLAVESDGDINKIASCQTLEGDLVIGDKVTSVVLPAGLTRITGSLRCDGADSLGSLSGAGLRSIGDEFYLRGLIRLGTLSFPMLGSVGRVAWETLPNLRELDFTTEITQADSVYISDTLLTTLKGINLVKASRFIITNNNYLKTVEVNLQNVTDILNVNFNAKGVTASFPKLNWAQNISLGDAGLASFPNLTEVKFNINMINNTFSELHFPKLLKVGSSFAIVSNSELFNLSAPLLKSTGGTFQLANNTKLESIGGFASLTSVGGAVDLSGNLKEVELPSLDDVRGGFNLQSTEDINCDAFNKLKGGVVRGTFKCAGGLKDAKSSTGGAGTKGDGKEGAATTVVANFGVLALAGAAALLAL